MLLLVDDDYEDEDNDISSTKECSICYLDKLMFKSCPQCIYTICTDCHSQTKKCPFCRFPYYYKKDDDQVFNCSTWCVYIVSIISLTMTMWMESWYYVID